MNLFHTALLKLLPMQRLINLRNAKNSKGKLKAEFTDENGRWWSTFSDEQDMPLIRLAAIQTHMQYLASGLTGQTFNAAMELLTECLAKNEIVNAGVVIHDLKETPKKILNLHSLINIIAVNYVRSDEDPNEVNESIHQQKCNWMLEQIEEGSFFLSHPSLIKSLNPFNLSGQQLESNLAACLKVLKSQRQRWDILRSMNESSKSTKTD